MVRNSNLEVKKSIIPGAGNGLFTKVKIKKGTIIGLFGGELITDDEADNRPDSYGWFVDLGNGFSIDCYKNDAKANYANDAQGLIKTRLKNNCNIQQDTDKDGNIFVCLIAEVDIPKGSEIFVSYGDSYWETFKNNYE